MDASLFWSLALIALVLVLFTLPVLPALMDLRANRAAEPIYINPAGNPLIPESGQALDVPLAPWPAQVESGSLFYRIQSSYIYFGSGSVPDIADYSRRQKQQQQEVAPFVDFDETPVHHENLCLEKGETLRGSRVVHGNLIMHDGSRLLGNIKVHGEAFLGQECVVSGSLFCLRNVKSKERVRLMGPVAVHSHLYLGNQSVLGTPSHPVSVSARTIELGEGSVAHGIVRALVRGRVVQSKWTKKASRAKPARH